jgi:Xaa-Pro dipeptidase
MSASLSFPPVSAARILQRAKTPCLLVSHLTNIRYCTGLELSAGFLLVEKRGFTLYVDARYSENAARKLGKAIRIGDPKALPAYLKTLKRCGFEAGHVPVAQYGEWKTKFKNTKFVQTVDVVEEFRRYKSAAELQSVRKACAITKDILRKVPSFLRRGVTEREVARRIADAAYEAGAESMAFDTIVGFGANTSQPHHRSTDAVFRAGDMVQIDMGVKVGGYCSDYSRVYFTKKPTVEQATVYRILSRVQRTMMTRVRAGVTNHALDAEARAMLAKHGYGIEHFSHALGHGVGLDIHDGIVLSGRVPETTLRKGEVVTIEPGLYFAGKWGMRIEDTVIVR